MNEPIRFYNRYSGEVETEDVYGEGFLRWAYGTVPGRAAVSTFVKRPFFSKWYGWRMTRPASRARVIPFIESYGLDGSEFAKEPEDFKSFNDFFYRRLKPEARPVTPGDDVVVFPADGRHFAISDTRKVDLVFVKGQRFDLTALFGGDRALAERFLGGALVFSRLCPVDYHRFHFPVAGEASAPRLLNGFLYSVSPIALRRRLAYLWENKRVLTLVESGRFGTVATLEVGATCVGSINYTSVLPGSVGKADEKGYFAFGGSATLTLFEPGKVALSRDLVDYSAQGLEVYAKMGDKMATLET